MKETKMELVAAHMNLMQEVEDALRKTLKLRMYNMDHTTYKVPQFRRDFEDAIKAAERLLGIIKN